MKEFREEREGSQITIWNEEKGVGLRFIEGEPLQEYTSDLIMKDPTEFTQTDDGLITLTRIRKNLVKYASGKYPKEFSVID